MVHASFVVAWAGIVVDDRVGGCVILLFLVAVERKR